MNERFRLNCAYILVLSILLRSLSSHCCPEFSKDASSNSEDGSDLAEELRNKLDPAIEQIFRGPNERKNDATDSKRNIETESGKTNARSEEIDKRARTKRESVAKRSNAKSSSQVAKNNGKRSLSKANDAPSRSGRSFRDLPVLMEKEDYEIPVDRDKSEYSDEPEDDSAVDSKNGENRYKASELRFGEDSEKFIDQEERSDLYDDFESKDVVKRGISGAEDYEETDEEGAESAEDVASLEERGTTGEEVDERTVRGDVRVKRAHESSQGASNADSAGKIENTGTSSDSTFGDSKREAGNDGNGDTVESQGNGVEKESNEEGEQSKRNVGEKIENDGSKTNSDRAVDGFERTPMGSDRTEMESNENAKLRNQEGRDTAGDKKIRELGSTSNEKAANEPFVDPSSLKGPSKSDESKVVDVSNSEATKAEVPADTLNNAPSEDTAKLDNSKSDVATGDRIDGDYEKRVEEQIQRKIDSIKEEIKREIAENRRVREIEENNAKFDELRDREDDDDDDEEEALEADPSERSLKNSGESRLRDSPEKRSTRRKKRQGETAREKVASESDSTKKARQTGAKKRSVARSEQRAQTLNELPKKREYPRRVYLVKRDRNAGKKTRRRRSKNAVLVPEQRTVKLDDNLPADFVLDRSLRGEPNGGKSSLSRMTEQNKLTAGRDSTWEKNIGSVASLTGSNEETGPLATEYGEAFGGLHGEPGVALARFKRIKRVLRPSRPKS